jgi:hypothetical protein
MRVDMGWGVVVIGDASLPLRPSQSRWLPDDLIQCGRGLVFPAEGSI